MRGLLCAMACLLLISVPAFADDVFFNELSDVPVMPGLAELPERTLVFDKPAGRIAHVTALRIYQEQELEGFYRSSLPQLGWKPSGPGVYTREGTKLTISEGLEQGQKLVVFRQEPYGGMGR